MFKRKFLGFTAALFLTAAMLAPMVAEARPHACHPGWTRYHGHCVRIHHRNHHHVNYVPAPVHHHYR